MSRQLIVGVCLVVCATSRPVFADSHGYLGVTVGIDKEGERGPTVQDVYPETPAAKAGLKDGDEIIKFGDDEPRNIEEFLKSVAGHKPGEHINLIFKRGNKQLSTTATLGALPTNGSARRLEEFSATSAQNSAYLGITIKPLTPEMQRRARIGTEAGVSVIDIVRNSPADLAGLALDDVIIGAGGRVIRSPEELRYMVQETGAGKELSVVVIRGNEKLTFKTLPRNSLAEYYSTPASQPVLQSDVDPSRRIQELENRIAELERRLQDKK